MIFMVMIIYLYFYDYLKSLTFGIEFCYIFKDFHFQNLLLKFFYSLVLNLVIKALKNLRDKIIFYFAFFMNF